MAITRAQIRDQIAAVIAAQNPALTMMVGRTAAIVNDMMPVCAIYMTQGAYNIHDMSRGSHTDAFISIDFTIDGDDDALDAISDPAIEAVLSDAVLQDLVLSMRVDSFEYDRDHSTTVQALRMTLTVLYVSR